MIKRFNRYELKYIIPIRLAWKLLADFKERMPYDSYCPENGYKLTSLYYDSTELDFFWNKIEGIKFRRKVRLRIYPASSIEETTHGMVEIKQCINKTVQKKRLKLPIDEGHDLCVNGILSEKITDPDDMQVAQEVKYISDSMQLIPTCITAYNRIALAGDYMDPGLRITFDTNVRYRTHALHVNQDAKNNLIIPLDWCVLEVKTNERIPDWVASILTANNCQLGRISKYCSGIARDRARHVMALAMTPPYEMKGY
ncbi:MAG: polyphosphate polymerase domain-containing protein [Deltaproteobacteria bacterium]|nr:polyphosphate polymerase domain-containing protein [Deltaproteobacteria bacterium]